MPHILTAIRSINQPSEGATAGLSIVKTETDHSLSFRVDGESKENTFRHEPKMIYSHLMMTHHHHQYNHQDIFSSCLYDKTDTLPERRDVRGLNGKQSYVSIFCLSITNR